MEFEESERETKALRDKLYSLCVGKPLFIARDAMERASSLLYANAIVQAVSLGHDCEVRKAQGDTPE